MKTSIKLLVIIAIALTAFGQATAVSAAEIYKWKGPGADAFFSSWDESGCVATDVSVFTRDETFQNPPGRPSEGTFVYLTINQYDFCGGGQLRAADGFAWIAEDDLQVAKKLSSATLSTVVTVYDWVSDSYFDVYVDLSWTANGPAAKEKSSYHSGGPGCKYHSRFQGTFRGAEVNGTITDGYTNYTPWTGWGTIFDARGSDSFINCS